MKGSDVILTTENGNLTVKGAKDKVVTFVDSNGKTADQIFFADTFYTPLDNGLTYDAKRTVLTASNKFTGNTIDLGEYLESVAKINSSATSQNLNIIGNSADNSIKAGKGADTISGGNGNDTLTGGAGSDVFIYEGGNDVITDYKAWEDSIKVNGTISRKEYSGKNVIFKIGSGSLTVSNSKDKEISVTDSSGTQIYSQTFDLLYDNNFMTEESQLDDVSEITDKNYSVGQIEISANINELANNPIVSAVSFDDK